MAGGGKSMSRRATGTGTAKLKGALGTLVDGKTQGTKGPKTVKPPKAKGPR